MSSPAPESSLTAIHRLVSEVMEQRYRANGASRTIEAEVVRAETAFKPPLPADHPCYEAETLLDEIEAKKLRYETELNEVWSTYKPTLQRLGVSMIEVPAKPADLAEKRHSALNWGFFTAGGWIGFATFAMGGIISHNMRVLPHCLAVDLTAAALAVICFCVGGGAGDEFVTAFKNYRFGRAVRVQTAWTRLEDAAIDPDALRRACEIELAKHELRLREKLARTP